MRYLAKFTNKKGLLHRFLDQSYADVLFGIMLSSISQIILPLKAILTHLYFKNYLSKVNLFIQNIFIGLFFISMSFMITFIAV